MRTRGFYVTILLLISILLGACAAQPTEEAPAAPTEAPPEEEQIEITIWSHWVDEPALRSVLEQILEDYEALNPNVSIEVEYSQKGDFLPAAINAFTVGEGGPDLFYVDREIEATFTIVDAGWAAPLEDIIDWSQMVSAAEPASTWENANGETHTWYGIMETYADMILYNPEIFDELGIVVPENYQFTADEFYDVVVTCREGGYDPFATGSGDRKYPGQYPSLAWTSSLSFGTARDHGMIQKFARHSSGSKA
jgi:ABC-type glycerol-3-phosphate transport system substrate-binding protein